MRFVLLCFALLLPTLARAEPITLKATDGVAVFGEVWAAPDHPHGEKPPVIIAFHQAGSNHAEYAPIAPRLVAAGFTVLAIDQRAGGDLFGAPQQDRDHARPLCRFRRGPAGSGGGTGLGASEGGRRTGDRDRFQLFGGAGVPAGGETSGRAGGDPVLLAGRISGWPRIRSIRRRGNCKSRCWSIPPRRRARSRRPSPSSRRYRRRTRCRSCPVPASMVPPPCGRTRIRRGLRRIGAACLRSWRRSPRADRRGLTRRPV